MRIKFEAAEPPRWYVLRLRLGRARSTVQRHAIRLLLVWGCQYDASPGQMRPGRDGMLHENYIVMRTKKMPPVSKKRNSLADAWD